MTGICKTILFLISLSCLVVAVILETLHLVIVETASQQQITVKSFVLAELLKAIVVHVKLVLRNQLCVTSVIAVIFVGRLVRFWLSYVIVFYSCLSLVYLAFFHVENFDWFKYCQLMVVVDVSLMY